MVTDRVVNIARYDANRGRLSIYEGIEARIDIRSYETTVKIRDPKSKKYQIFNASPIDGDILAGEQFYFLWSEKPIDIRHFKEVVWNYRLEHYGHMVSKALALIRTQKARLAADEAALRSENVIDMGCEEDSVYSLRKQNGELKDKLHKARLLGVEFLLEMGLSDKSIAEELDISEDYARALCAELGDTDE